MIWLATLPPSRIVQISYVPALRGYISRCPPPAALSICRASRYIAKKHYEALKLGDSPIPIHFDFAVDKLYVSSIGKDFCAPCFEILGDMAGWRWRDRLRSLFLDMRFFNILCDCGLLKVLAGLNGLKELGLVVEYGTAYMGHQRYLDVCLSGRDMWRATKIAQRTRMGPLDVALLRNHLKEKERRYLKKIGQKKVERHHEGPRIRLRSVFLTKGGRLV